MTVRFREAAFRREGLRSLGLLALAAALATPCAAVQPELRPLDWRSKVDARLLAAPPEAEQELLVVLEEQADLSGARDLATKAEKGQYVYEQLTETARRTQGPLLAELAERGLTYQSFWITNMVLVRGRAELVEALARRSEVARIEPNPRIPMRLPLPEKVPSSGVSTEGVEQVESGPEWNIVKVGAPQVWAAGVTGQGVVVAGADTGYDWTHPALKGKYRGWNGTTANHNYNWHDAIHNAVSGNPCGSNSPAPCDDDSHGTHTMGIMVGDDGAGNQIGMAPGAKWIGCRNMDEGTGTPARYTECFQWFLAPTDSSGANPDPTKAPDVINNSWDCPPSEGCTDPNTLKSVIESVRAAGIAVVVAAGNQGPACNSMDVPEKYEAAIDVGATNSSDTVESYSSRGPGENGILKPEVVAPGSGIRSSVPGGGYASMSGTSMASPHGAGMAALLLSASPGLSVTGLEVLMEQTAVAKTTTDTCGGIAAGVVPNDTAGYGRINALAGYTSAVASNVPPSISITSPASGAKFTAPATIAIAVSASDTGGGTVARVDLYAGSVKLATLTAAPYTFNWTNVAVGTYSLTALATDNQGASTTSAAVSVTVSAASLPAPWVAADIGPVGAAGSSSFANGVFTVKASGSDIWYASDQFRFVYQPLSGDGEIVARVATVQNTNVWAKAGVMIRETLAANSAFADMIVTPASGAAFQRRLTAGVNAVGTTVSGVAAPQWVRLVRSGSTFTAYRSVDGASWIQVGSATIAMAGNVYVGLALTSHNHSVLCTATFDNVAVSAAWASADIGAVGLTGSFSSSNGTDTVKGSGKDIWYASDQFRYVYRPLSGDGEIVARVVSVQNTNVWAKAGVMIRETLSVDSTFADMLVTPASGVAFQRRLTTGVNAVGTTVTGIGAPQWVRLVRSGNVFTAYRSADGVSWTQVGTATIPMAANVYVGLAVTAHNNAALCTAVFDNVLKTP